MKKLTKIIVLASALTMLFALPVMANEDKIVTISSESSDQLVALIDAHNLQLLSALEDVTKFASSDAAMADAKIHMNVVYKQIRKEDQDICANHIYYLQQKVNNAVDNVRIKNEIIANYTSLSVASPYYLQFIPQAQADLLAAQNKVVEAQNNLAAAQAKFAKYYL